MMTFTTNKAGVALFADALLQCSKSDFLSITITKQVTFVDCFALTVTGMSSDDTVKTLGQAYLKQLMNT
jgi:hypothetical protein